MKKAGKAAKKDVHPQFYDWVMRMPNVEFIGECMLRLIGDDYENECAPDTDEVDAHLPPVPKTQYTDVGAAAEQADEVYEKLKMSREEDSIDKRSSTIRKMEKNSTDEQKTVQSSFVPEEFVMPLEAKPIPLPPATPAAASKGAPKAFARVCHGALSREDIDVLLQPECIGTYLVRESTSRKGDYALSLRMVAKVNHYKLVIDGESFKIAGRTSQSRAWTSLDDMVLDGLNSMDPGWQPKQLEMIKANHERRQKELLSAQRVTQIENDEDLYESTPHQIKSVSEVAKSSNKKSSAPTTPPVPPPTSTPPGKKGVDRPPSLPPARGAARAPSVRGTRMHAFKPRKEMSPVPCSACKKPILSLGFGRTMSLQCSQCGDCQHVLCANRKNCRGPK